MSLNEINPANSLKTGVDSFTGLPGSISDINRDLFRSLSNPPNSALGGIPMNPLLESDDRTLSSTPTKARSDASSVYGDESEIFPIDRTAVQASKALMDSAITAPLPSGDQVDRAGGYDELLNPNPSNLSATVSWLDRADKETYSGNFLPSDRLSSSDRLDSPFVGVIDTGFSAQDRGTQVINVIQRVGHQFPDPNVTSSSSREASSLDSPLKYEPGVPLQYDEQVKQWQQRMQERGWNIADDGLYGSQSAQIARQFQQEKGLGVDGIVGPDTWAATFDTTKVDATNNVTNSPSSGSPSLDRLLKYEPGVPLKYDEQVKQWQQRMSDRGWNIDVDGLYGPQSAQIARQFQQEKGLAVDGIVGLDTWAATFDTNNATGSIPAPPNTSTPLSDPAQKLLNVARSYIGVREQGGNNRGRQVEEFQKAIGGAAAEPWCMSFAQYCIKAAESETQANSQVPESEHCLTVWNGSPSQLRRSRPEPGSLVIWRHGNSTSGHVGIVEAVNSDGTFTTIEGNTSDSSGINREGNGVYRKQRDMDGEGNMRVVGFLKVFPDYTPVDVSEPSSSVATSVATMSNLEKLEEAFKRAISRVDDEASRQLEELLTPENIAIMAGTMALWAASHGTPIGWIVDGVLLGVGIFTIGTEIFEAGKDIFEFATGALEAETEADLDQAGQHLAEAIATVGIEVVAGILTRKAIEGGAPERPTLPEQPKPLDPPADNAASPPPFGIVHTPSDDEINDAVESSHDAADKVADKEQKYQGKSVTYATTANGQIFRNGWAENPELVDAVENFMYEHDIEFARSGSQDNGLDARAKAAHAERKAFMDVLQREPDTRIISIGVNAPLCDTPPSTSRRQPFLAACTDFFTAAARVTGKTIVTTEMERGQPNVRKTLIWRPNGESESR
ncbi:MAG: CHAP domain-containing protein [Microcoleus sp. CSU_2_2]|nr:CHAP domain-containing protein [Microcoleus sp. CSU_2_2]